MDARDPALRSVSSQDSAIIESPTRTPAVKETGHESSTRELDSSSDPNSQDVGGSGGGEEAPCGFDSVCRDSSRTIAVSSTAASKSRSSRDGNSLSDADTATNSPKNVEEMPDGRHNAFKGGNPTTNRRHPHPHQDQLIPARLAAVLLDGAGKGWIAARRLLSVREVGSAALAEAGLGSADVDLEQEVSLEHHGPLLMRRWRWRGRMPRRKGVRRCTSQPSPFFCD